MSECLIIQRRASQRCFDLPFDVAICLLWLFSISGTHKIDAFPISACFYRMCQCGDGRADAGLFGRGRLPEEEQGTLVVEPEAEEEANGALEPH